MKTMEFSFLLSTLVFKLVVKISRGECLDCFPPEFPDFISMFENTLKLIPDLMTTIDTATSYSCASSVDWTVFNDHLAAENPISLNQFCISDTTAADSITISASSVGEHTPSKAILVSSSSSSSSSFSVRPQTTKDSNMSITTAGALIGPTIAQPDEISKNNLGLYVGIPVGVGGFLLLLIVVLSIVCIRQNSVKQRRSVGIDRAVSSASQTVLINDDVYISETTTPTPGFNHWNDGGSGNAAAYSAVSSPLKIAGISLETSTDSTIPRRKIKNGGRVWEKPSFPLDEEKGEEQKMWENFINSAFDKAKLESIEDLTVFSKGDDDNNQSFSPNKIFNVSFETTSPTRSTISLNEPVTPAVNINSPVQSPIIERPPSYSLFSDVNNQPSSSAIFNHTFHNSNISSETPPLSPVRTLTKPPPYSQTIIDDKNLLPDNIVNESRIPPLSPTIRTRTSPPKTVTLKENEAKDEGRSELFIESVLTINDEYISTDAGSPRGCTSLQSLPSIPQPQVCVNKARNESGKQTPPTQTAIVKPYHNDSEPSQSLRSSLVSFSSFPPRPHITSASAREPVSLFQNKSPPPTTTMNGESAVDVPNDFIQSPSVRILRNQFERT